MKYCTFYLQGQTLTETWKVESDISKSGKFSCKRVAGKSGKSGKKSLGDTANHINPHTTRWVKKHYSLFVQQIESSRSINISDSLSLKQDRKNQSINKPVQVPNSKLGSGEKGLPPPPPKKEGGGRVAVRCQVRGFFSI